MSEKTNNGGVVYALMKRDTRKKEEKRFEVGIWVWFSRVGIGDGTEEVD